MANLTTGQDGSAEDSLYPIAVLIDELRNEDVQVFPTPTRYNLYTI